MEKLLLGLIDQAIAAVIFVILLFWLEPLDRGGIFMLAFIVLVTVNALAQIAKFIWPRLRKLSGG